MFTPLFFGSKNFKNILVDPGKLQDYNLYFQYTINNYSKLLEPNVPEYNESLKTLEGLIKRYSPKQFNLRFDPIMISLEGENCPTPDKPGRARLIAFEGFCRDIKAMGMEECRITTSYISFYGHVKSRLERLNIGLIQLNEDMQKMFFERMVEIAQKYDLKLYSCANPILEQVPGILKGHCIDGELLENLFGGKVKKSKDTGQRKDCGCSFSRDIGAYSRTNNGMKCLHGCKYCYVL